MPAMATSQAGRAGASGWFYVLGILMMFGGCGAPFGALLWSSAADIESMQRFVMPGAQTMTLSPGQYVLYAETSSVVDGKSYMWTGGSVSCQVIESETQRPVTSLSAASMNESYTIGGYKGESMFELDIEQGGSFVLGCEVEGGPMVIAINRGRVLGNMVYPMLGGLLVFALGIAVIVVTRKKRRVSQHR